MYSGVYKTSWATPCNTGTVKKVSQFNMHSAHTSYIPRCEDLSVGPSQSQVGERKQVGGNRRLRDINVLGVVGDMMEML